VAYFTPQPHHCAAPPHFVNGGIVATLIDCHSICSATAFAYLQAGRPLGSAPLIYLVTGSLSVRYLRPTPLAATLTLRADVAAVTNDRFTVSCTLEARNKICATGELLAVRVGESWMMEEQERSG